MEAARTTGETVSTGRALWDIERAAAFRSDNRRKPAGAGRTTSGFRAVVPGTDRTEFVR
jgi:hypothetical protein